MNTKALCIGLVALSCLLTFLSLRSTISSCTMEEPTYYEEIPGLGGEGFQVPAVCGEDSGKIRLNKLEFNLLTGTTLVIYATTVMSFAKLRNNR